jgi:putative hydrolase of the HAD superfamily
LAAMDALKSRPARPSTLDHVEAWVFDLDNTLYPASCNLFAEIDRRMAAFIGEAIGVDALEARRIQKAYFDEYGTTLRGMMLNHAVDPDHFLDYVHRIDMTPLAPSPALETALAAIEGPKFIFTNGSARHAEKVMDRLGVAHHFDGVFDVTAASFRAKPDPEAYLGLIRRHDLVPAATAFFEDLMRNLAPAAALGMTTVWVRDEESRRNGGGPQSPPPYVHHETDDLVGWLEALAAARRARS